MLEPDASLQAPILQPRLHVLLQLLEVWSRRSDRHPAEEPQQVTEQPGGRP